MKPTKPGRAQGRGQGQGQGKTRRKQPVQQNLRRARKAMKKMVELVLTREGAGGLGAIGEKSLGKKGQALHLLSSSYTRVPGVQPSKRNDISASQGMTQELSEEKTTDAASSSQKKKRKKKKKRGLVDSETLTPNKQRTDGGTTVGNHGALPPNLKGGEIATDENIGESSTKKKKRKKKLIVVDKKEARKLAALPRKARRREEKKLKKSKRQTFIQEKSTSGAAEREGNHPSGKSSSGKASQDSKTKASEKKRQKRKRKSDKLKKEEEEQRKQQLIKANEREEKTIRQLERDLNFRKKKKTKEKITPMAFRDDGLDYLLDIVDPKFLEDEGEMEEGFMDLGEESNMDDEDSASDNLENDDEGDDLEDEEDDDDRFGDGSEDGEPRTKLRKGLSKKDSERNSGLDSDDEEEEEEEEEEDGSRVDLRTKGKRKRTETAKNKAKSKHLGEQNEDLEDDDEQDEDDVDDIDDQEDDDDENIGSEDDSYSDDDDEDDEEEEEEEVDEDMEEIAKLPKMDPYGNVIGSKQPEKKMGAYVPPHKRAEMMGQEVDAERKAKLDRLRKQLKGAINRLSESNAQSICNQIEDLYLSNSRNDMNETLTSLVQDACIGQALTPERLAMEHILMIAVLHARVGSEVGAHLLQALASRFETLHGDDGCYGDGKELDNIVLLLVHLYNFKIVHCVLIYDLIKRFAEKFTERDIEMLLHILKSSGASLRKDDPSSLKDIILLIQGKANQCPEELKQQSRVKFMLETIGALRNNNLHKIPNYDPSHLQTLRALHRNLIKDRGHNDTDSTLRISLADLISAKERGRWWIVGSAWSGYGPKMDVSAKQSDQGMETQEMMKDETSQKIVELSRQQRMNTDLRRTIFSIIMTAEDFMDAFEKLVRLGQKGGRDREVVQVCLDCCQQEKAFNPYYAHLGTKLCLFDRKFRMAFQFALWDKLRLLEELTPSNTKNLALLIAHLIASKALPLTVLKVIEFADINKATVLFLQTLLQDLLLERPDSTISSVFGGVASVTKLRLLREGLGLFMHHFLMKGVRRKVKRMLESREQGGEGLEERLKERIGIAETAMNEGDGMLKVKGDVGF